MTTARELLEEVDALMRRNRLVRMEPRDTPPERAEIVRPDDDSLLGPVRESQAKRETLAVDHDAPLPQALATPLAPPNDDIPVLTEVADMVAAHAHGDVLPRPAASSGTAAQGSDGRSEPRIGAAADDLPVLTDAAALDDVPLLTDAAPVDDVPVLTDAVAVDDRMYQRPTAVASPPTAVAALAMTHDAGVGMSDEDAALIGGLPASAFGVVAASLAAHASARPQPQSRLAADDPRWTALAEDVRFQVLQHLDLFTESGLDQRLQTHIQPIVDRASAELVGMIHAQLGHVLRSFVSDAIDREIERWRQDLH